MKLPQLPPRIGWLASGLLLTLLPGERAHAFQCENFGPVSPDFRVNASSPYDQIWGRVARNSNSYTFTWCAGQDVWARRYNANLVPTSGDFQVNTVYTAGTQDEPEVAYSIYGNTLFAWNDREGNDGQGMGLFGRVYNSGGVPLGPEFQINANSTASQWRPLIAPTPAGGYCVAWSGDWDGDSFFRLFDSTGVPVSGDVQVNTFQDNAQVDAAPAVNNSGTIFIAFIDFASHGGVGTLFNLWGRTFSSTGVPNQVSEFPITTTTGDGHQRDPRVAADGLGRFIVVWESDIHDGSGYGIFARRYGANSLPIGPEFQVNSITSGDQLNATIAAKSDGGFVVCWNDWSTGAARIRARRFDPNAQPIGAEFTVNQSPSSGVERPSMALKWLGTELVVAYSGPGDAKDVFAKRFTVANGPIAYGTPVPHSYGCGVTVTSSGTPSISDPNPFTITANNVINQSLGTMWFSQNAAFTPFVGETLLLAPPVFSTVSMASNGNTVPPHDCSGSFSFDFNALLDSGTMPFLTAGTTINVQFTYRDSVDPNGTGMGLSNGLRFTICP